MYFKQQHIGKGTASCLELPSSVRREVEVGGDWTGRSGNGNAQDEKRQGDRSR